MAKNYMADVAKVLGVELGEVHGNGRNLWKGEW